MPQTITIPIPTKGVNRYGPRSEQPLQTTPDALNVLPFDRYGRQRIGQRPGTGKLWESSIGSDGLVQFIRQTAIGTTTTTFDEVTFSDAFTYSNGQLDTVSAGVWESLNGASNGAAADADITVSTNRVTGAASRYARVATIYTLGTTYSVQTEIHLPAVLANVYYGGLVTRGHTTPGAGVAAVQFELRRAGGVSSVRATTENGTLLVPDSGAASGVVTTTGGAVHTLRVIWTGNTYVAYFDGVQAFTGTTTYGAGQERVGVATTVIADTFYDDFLLSVGFPASTRREVALVAVANGNVYMGDVGDQGALVTNGTGILNTVTRPSGATLFSRLYIVDGTDDIVDLNLDTRTADLWTATGGSETRTTLGLYTIAAAWRGRLVLAGAQADPHNFIASRVGDPYDFDYADTDPAAAFAGNAVTNGQVGDIITALIPMSEDRLLIGGDQTLWVVEGDPAAGGSINLISDSTGILNQHAWTKSPDGTTYFIGTTGLFAIAPGSRQPELLTAGTYNQFFSAINRQRQHLSLAWDRDRHGCYIFVTPVISGTATHLFFDVREGGFWPVQFPASHGPICCAIYDGDDPSDRYLLMGGRTGYIQIASDTTRRDDASEGSTAISSYVILGPIQPFPPVGDGIITGLDVTTGEVFTGDAASVWNMNWTIETGKSAYEVTDGTARRTASGNLGVAGWQNTRVPRLRGGWFTLKFSNSNDGDYFSLERVALRVKASGRQR